MDVSGKVWGKTSCIFAKSNVEIHRIQGDHGGSSSMHKHKSKWSMFFVERGMVEIEVEKNDYKLTDVTTLEAGQSTVLKPDEFHRFKILHDNTVCYEIYWTELDTNDIVRRDVGSKGDDHVASRRNQGVRQGKRKGRAE